jgi:hypothetical protein
VRTQRPHGRCRAKMSVLVPPIFMSYKVIRSRLFNVTPFIGAEPCATELLWHFVLKDHDNGSDGVVCPPISTLTIK